MKGNTYNSIKIDIKLSKGKGNKSKNKDENSKKVMCDLCDIRNRRICTLCLNETDYNEQRMSKKQAKYCTVCSNPLSYIIKDTDPSIDPCSSKEYECETLEAKDKRNATNKNHTASNNQHFKTKNCEKFEDSQIQKNDSVMTNDKVDISQGLNLLTEVLNVFQNKKIVDKANEKDNKKFKDASINTEEQRDRMYILRNKLSRSNVVRYSIQDDKRLSTSSNFVILEARQPEFVKSQFCLNLKRGKSSSIPQMKLEELKQSLKERTKSKDAVEEVNRMFATVRKSNDDSENSIGSNRPMVRNGPRVLPVVRTGSKILMAPRETRDNYCAVSPRASTRCQHCQTGLSAGDSKHTKKCRCEDIVRCEKCTYMLSQSHGQKGIMMCEGIRKSSCQCRDITIWNTNQ